MKRDMELVRAILLAIEECDEGENTCHGEKISAFLKKKGYNHAVDLLHGHFKIMTEGGLIRCYEVEYAYHRIFFTLTWEGHEFLSDIKDKNVWDKVKEVVSKRDGISFAVLKTIATEISKQLL